MNKYKVIKERGHYIVKECVFRLFVFSMWWEWEGWFSSVEDARKKIEREEEYKRTDGAIELEL